MKKYVRLLASYAAIAISGMVLYTPWLVGLTPTDPSILRAGLSVICGIVLTGAFGASTYSYLHEPEYRLLEAADVDDVDDVLPQLRGFAELPVVGSTAAEAAGQIETMERRRNRLEKIIVAKFGAESLSHDKFAAVVEAAWHTLLRNCALLCNRIQAFDLEGYRKLRRSLPASARRALPSVLDLESPQPQSRDLVNTHKPMDGIAGIEAERAALYEEALRDMRDVLEANERLLLEMGKLEMELSDLESDDNRDDNTRMLDEVKELIEQTQYYR